MVGLGPGAIGDVMSDSRRKSKDPAEGFAIGISVMLALGVIIEIVMSAISGEASIKSLWTYLEGIAAIYPFCFLIFLAFFGRSPGNPQSWLRGRLFASCVYRWCRWLWLCSSLSASFFR